MPYASIPASSSSGSIMFCTVTAPKSIMKACGEASETGSSRTGAWTSTSTLRYLSHAWE